MLVSNLISEEFAILSSNALIALDNPSRSHCYQRQKPPRAPKRRQNSYPNARSHVIPYAVAVGCYHLKRITAGLNMRIGRDSPLADIHPVFIYAAKQILESHMLRL